MTILGDDRELSTLMANHAAASRYETLCEAIDKLRTAVREPQFEKFMEGLYLAIDLLKDMQT